MKRLYLLFLFLVLVWNGFGQTGEWTWMSGDSIGGGNGIFGVKGVPSSTNHPPSLYEAGEWTDLQGNFWLFGGVSWSALDVYADLWKYDVSSNQWTWVNGTGIPN